MGRLDPDRFEIPIDGETAERQGLEFTREGYQLTPQAFRIFQSRLLETIFNGKVVYDAMKDPKPKTRKEH